MFGLSPDVVESIKGIISGFPQIEKVIIYGSRAKGTYKDGSDIDLTLVGDDLTLKTVYALEDKLDDLYLPYTFDISIFSRINNPDLIQHITDFGKPCDVKGF